MNSATEPVLHLRMLGGFSVSLGGKTIAGGSKATDQTAYLLMILLHNREHGIARSRLEQLLFEDRDMSDAHHALQSVIYNTKKKMDKAGLPQAAGCIVQNKGIFYWASPLRIVDDTNEFLRLYSRGNSLETLSDRCDAYLEAVHWYSGEFLPGHTAAIWVAQEARRFKDLFKDCTEKAAALLRQQQDYIRLEALGRYAAGVDPFSDWETLTMEGLVYQGRYEDARTFYDQTVSYYISELGMRPSRTMMDKFGRLGDEMQHKHQVLDTIQDDLTAEAQPGGYLCTYPVFRGVYRVMERLVERGTASVYLMLCTVVDGKGNPIESGPSLEELSERMTETIQKTIRHGDVMCRYGKGQVLVLLMNTTRENCDIVQKRINKAFQIGRQRTGISYYVNSLFR